MECRSEARPLLSIVLPCFNEVAVLPQLWARLSVVADDLPADCEFLFVDDGSTDGTRERLEALSAEDPRVKLLAFSRNFGHQAALTAGLDYAHGDAVVMMDADLQDPPELLPEFLNEWTNGADVVTSCRTRRHGEHPIRLWVTRWAYRLLQAGSQISLTPEAGDFRLLDRQVVEALHNLREPDRYLRGMICWLGFREVQLTYERPARAAGQSHYGWRQLFSLAVNGWFSFCGNPLRFLFYLGIALMLFSGLLMTGMLPVFPIDQRSLAALMCGLAGMLFFSVAWQGEYLHRIYLQDKRRPLYVLRRQSHKSREHNEHSANHYREALEVRS